MLAVIGKALLGLVLGVFRDAPQPWTLYCLSAELERLDAYIQSVSVLKCGFCKKSFIMNAPLVS